MASGVICTIKLDKFYQAFLRNYYECNDIVFHFPREDSDKLGIARMFRTLLITPPLDYKPVEYGDNKFLIEVPEQHDRSSFYYNYLSQRRIVIFVKYIESSFKFFFHLKMMEYMNEGHSIKNSIILFMDEHQLDSIYTDRLTKDFQRWRNCLRVKKHLNNNND